MSLLALAFTIGILPSQEIATERPDILFCLSDGQSYPHASACDEPVNRWKILPEQAADAQTDAQGKAPKTTHFDPVVQIIEGWTVHVDPQMLEGEHAEAGARALTMLANHLQRIAILMPENRLEEMRKLDIWIEHDHPEINVEPGPYHRGVEWLVARGYDPRLEKKVHVTRAASLLRRHPFRKRQRGAPTVRALSRR